MENEMLDFVKALTHADRLRIIGALTTRKSATIKELAESLNLPFREVFNHLAFLKHPVVGDRVYGRRRQLISCPRQFLHAMRLVFKQPETEQSLSVEAPLAEDLQVVLRGLVEQ